MNPWARVMGAFAPWSDVWVRSGWHVQLHCMTGRARVLSPARQTALQDCEEACIDYASRMAPSARRRRAVILLHGIANYPGIMKPAARVLETRGWAVANLRYPSVRLSLQAHAATVSRVARALSEDGAETVAFAGHSLGGAVACATTARASRDGWNPGRLLMAGTPATGSDWARILSQFPLYATVLGDCGQTLTPAGIGLVPPPTCAGLAVIAGGTGSRGWNPLLQGDDDGVVRVCETRMPEQESDFMLVRSLHDGLPGNPQSLAALINFLETGRLRT